jgi:hypothetical protein
VGDFSAAIIHRVQNGVQEVFVPQGFGGLQSPGGLFFLPSGDLLVADLFANKILHYDANGENPQVFAVIPPEIPVPLPPGAFFASNFPSDIALDPNGNLLVAVLGITNPEYGGADNNGAILRYDLDGNLLEMQTIGGLTPISSIAWIASPTAITGDYDGNLSVGPSDYDKWRTDFGKWVARGGGADGNGDGFVDAADYIVWRKASSLGEVAGAAAAVPEPSTVALVIGAVGLLVHVRRRFA